MEPKENDLANETSDRFSQALEHFYSREFQRAEELCRALLNAQPLHHQAHNLLGLILANTQQLKPAVNHFFSAIGIAPNNGEYVTNLAHCYSLLDEKQKVGICRGFQYSNDKAQTACEIADGLCIKEDFDDALRWIELSIHLRSKHAPAYVQRGRVFQSMGDTKAAAKDFMGAILLEQDNEEAMLALGSLLQTLKDYGPAYNCFKKALAVNPENPFNLIAMGNFLLTLGKYQEAIDILDRAIAVNSEHSYAHAIRAACLIAQNNFDEAIPSLDTALRTETGYGEAASKKRLAEYYAQKALIHHIGENLDETKTNISKALEFDPQCSQALFIQGTLALREKDFTLGWNLYSWRWKSHQAYTSTHYISSKPTCSKRLEPGRLFIWGEAGIGDQILFASMFNDLAKGGHNAIISCEKKLLPLFSRSFPNHRFVAIGETISEDRYDFQMPAGNLGRFLRQDANSFPASNTYLKAKKSRTTAIRRKIQAQGKLICGISWKSANPLVGDSKSLPLAKLVSDLELPSKFHLVNLQYGDVHDEINQAKTKHNAPIQVMEKLEVFDDIDGLAALIAACDLVITTSNSTTHLAGALGKPTLLLAPAGTGRLWYWHEKHGQSLWYPSIQIFGQHRMGDWDSALADAAGYLRNTF